MSNLLKTCISRRNRPAWMVLLVCVVLTWWVWSGLRGVSLRAAQQEFNLHVEEIEGVIADRLRQHEQILLGGAGLYDASGAVTRANWHAYAERLQLGRNYPGIQGLGFGQLIAPAQLQAHIASVRAEGFPHYTVRPSGERPLYAPIIYLEPFSGSHLAAFGFDMMSEATRAQAMRLAAQTGNTAITGKVSLVQETEGSAQAGFLMYVPVYRPYQPLTTATERWHALQGFVYSPLRVNDLMRGILGERLGKLDCTIDVGPQENGGARLYASTEGWFTAEGAARPLLNAVRTMQVYGQMWTIRFQSRPEFESGFDSFNIAVPVVGGSISALLFFLVSFLTSRRNQAQALARKITVKVRALQERRVQEARDTAEAMRSTLYEKERHQQAVNVHALVSATDPAGSIIYANSRFCAVSGYSRDELLGRNHRILKSGEHPPEFYREMWETLARGQVWQGELCNRRKDGRLYWVSSTITPFLGEDGKPYQYVSIRTEITAIKEIEQQLRLKTRAMEASINGISIADAQAPDLPLTYVNAAFERITGYSAGEVLGRNCRFLHGDDVTQAGLEEIRSALREQRAGKAILRNFRKSGALFWNELTIAPVRDAKGEVTHYIGVNNDITERKRAEEAVETYKERLRRGQLFANIGTWEWNIQSGDLFWTERIAPLFGYPQGDLETSYDNFLAAVHPDDRQAVGDAINACVERDAPYDIEHRVVWPDGTVRWLLERGAVLRDADGKPLRMLGVVQDIHERKQIELALVESEKRLREAQSLARLGHWQADMQSGGLFWSGEIYRIFGRDPATFQPSVEAFQAAVHPDDRALVQDSEMRALQTGMHDVLHRIVRPDGTVRHVHELARAERAVDGRLLRLTGTVQDITDDVEAKEKLRQSDARFVFAVEGAGDGIWDWNLLTGAMSLSGYYETMLGYDKGEMSPTIDAWVASVHPDDLARAQQNLQDYLAGKVPAYVVELRLRCKDGDYKWILCRGTVVARDGAGKPVRMIGIHSDITEAKAAQTALVEAREAAERANQAKSDFLSSMSHELRTPMNAILGFGQLLAYDDALSEEHQDNVQEILKAGHHLLELINEVLDLAKVESGHISLSLEQVELSAIVAECLPLVRGLADKRGIQLSHQGLAGVVLRADRTRLKQALLNLLSNAIKYNREGGSVKISAQTVGEDADRLRIRVTDSGMGIPGDRLTELFQPFNRLGAEGTEVDGTGIGLTITRRIVELMGGSVDVESEVGVGSTFWIELPLEYLAGAEDGLAPKGSATHGATPARHMEAAQRTVLYIEDNPANIKLVAQMMGHRKHIHLLTAHTPALGIELALARRPELILLDVNMPVMDGYQVLEILKAEASLKSIPVIAVTANALPRDIERGKKAGFSAYLAKPIDVRRFLQAIDACLLRQTDDNKKL